MIRVVSLATLARPLMPLSGRGVHTPLMDVSSVSGARAKVELSQTEVLALSNLLLNAPHVPFEGRGPGEIFARLSEDFERLRDQMTE
jgi:hypothetical protein